MNFETLYNEPRVYAYEIIGVPEKKGWLKVGYTERQNVQDRIKQQLRTANIQYRIVIDEAATTNDGKFFRDTQVHQILEEEGFVRGKFEDESRSNRKEAKSEWFKCTKEDVIAVISALQERRNVEDANMQTYKMRPEQKRAVMATAKYFREYKREDDGQPPSFLWNAKMRFGKTFTTYQLAKEMSWKRVLVLTFKPAVEGSWQEDMEHHIDFRGWQFVSNRENSLNWSQVDESRPVVWFGSFQDFLGKDRKTGVYKVRNKEAFGVEWDCVVVDEYHFGAWRKENRRFTGSVEGDEQESEEEFEIDKSPLRAKNYLMLSGTPFRAISNGEFLENQIFNWTYSDEQQAKAEWKGIHANEPNPYAALPQMNMLVYRLPEKIVRVAEREDVGFDLNEFFRAEKNEECGAKFVHENEVSKWLDFIRGEEYFSGDSQTPVLPYYDVGLKRALRHVIWFLPSVASCEAMYKLLHEDCHKFYRKYSINRAFGNCTGVGLGAMEAIENVTKNPLEGNSITLTCGKLTTGVTVNAWSAIFMLRSLSSPETYFQAAFRVQNPWTLRNMDGKNPNEVTILKEKCYVFDFALNRALRQIADYCANLSDKESIPAENVGKFINFMPIICYDGSSMSMVDSGQILDLAYSGMSGPAMARRWNSANLLNITPTIIDEILNNEKALEAMGKIQGFANPRSVLSSFVTHTKEINNLKKKSDKNSKKKISEEERKLQKEREKIEKRLKKFVTRIPIFMYLSNYREKALKDVIENMESNLFTHITGLDLSEFNLLVEIGVFDSAQMNSCIWQFRAYEEESLDYLHLGKDATSMNEMIGGWDSTAQKSNAYK